MATEIISWTLAGSSTILRLNTPNFKVTSIERIQCGGNATVSGVTQSFCSSGTGTPTSQKSLDSRTNSETTGSVLKATANGQVVLDVVLPSNAFSTTGRLTLNNPTYTSGMRVVAKLIGDIV